MNLYEHHNMSNSSNKSTKRLYTIWGHMKHRCNCKTCDDYKNYGGRGIKVCQQWVRFSNFYNWAINNGYKDNLTLDRIDVNGNYEPNNCRWATIKQQINNTRVNRLLTFEGCTKTMQEWCDILNFSKQLIYNRLKLGWSVDKALKTPARKKIKK